MDVLVGVDPTKQHPGGLGCGDRRCHAGHVGPPQ
jgi:hypothetical protein